MKKIETKFGTYMEREDDPTKLTGDKIKVFVERLKKLGIEVKLQGNFPWVYICLLYTSPSPRDRQKSRMPSSA